MAEIGALAGYSAVRFASKIREISGPDVRYYSFEIGPGFADIASQVN
jgi:catechol O-methyltransferase